MHWYISDTHFGHERIIDLCNRPFDSVTDMNETMIDNWNSLVGDDDTVFHLGDVALGPWAEWDGLLSRLNGEKVLIIGNHERVFETNKQKYIDRFWPVYSQWFAEIYSDLDVAVGGEYLVHLSHFPYDGDSHEEDRYSDFRLPDDGIPLIHGHTHENNIVSRSARGSLQIHVGADAWDYTPVSEDQILKILETHES